MQSVRIWLESKITKFKNYLVQDEILNHKRVILISFFTLSICFIFIRGISAIAMHTNPEIQNPLFHRASVLENGLLIKFPKDNQGLKLIKSESVKKGTTMLTVAAPARVILSVPHHQKDQSHPTMHFESNETNALYSQYKQSKSNYERNNRNLERIRDTFKNQLTTVKEFNDAENDFVAAQAMMHEYEGKLRSHGIDPDELTHIQPGTVRLIADVPESQLQEVDHGEEVKVTITSFPDRIFFGKTEAVGDIIDPITRTVKVRVSLTNPDGKVLPGMFARCDFGDPKHSVISVPLSSVVTVEEQDYIFIEKSPTEFERRAVVMTHSNGNEGIVLSGMKEGEQVVTSGAILLKGLSFGY